MTDLSLNIFDYSALFLLLIGVAYGWERGFFRAIVLPAALAIAYAASFYIYNTTDSLQYTLLTAIGGTLFFIPLLNLIFRLLGLISEHPNYEPKTFTRFLGGMFNIVWFFVILLGFIYFTLHIPPTKKYSLDKTQTRILKSQTYELLYPYANKQSFIPAPAYLPGDSTIIKTVATKKSIFKKIGSGDTSGMSQINNIFDDYRMQNMVNDPEFRKKAESGDIQGMFTDKRVRDMATDPETLQKVLSIYGGMMAPQEEE